VNIKNKDNINYYNDIKNIKDRYDIYDYEYYDISNINLAFFYNNVENIKISEYNEPIPSDALILINKYNESMSSDECTIAHFNCNQYYIYHLISIIEKQNINDDNVSNNTENNDLDFLYNFESLNDFESTTDKKKYVKTITDIWTYIDTCKNDVTKQKPLITNVIYLTILLNNFMKTLTMLKVIFEKLYHGGYIKIKGKTQDYKYNYISTDSSSSSNRVLFNATLF
jgi:hypothetical protein